MNSEYKSISFALDNEHTIYADIEGQILKERLGVTKILTEDDEVVTIYNTLYGDDVINGDADHDYMPSLGKRGDKWDSVKPLGELIEECIRKNSSEYVSIFSSLDDYFVVDKSKAEDTIWLEFDPYVAGENHARLDIHSNFYVLGSPLFFDYTRPLSHFATTDNDDTYTMQDIVKCLDGYQEWLDKPLKVICSFAYVGNVYHSEETHKADAEYAKRLEDLYVQPIEDYINNGLAKGWKELLDANEYIRKGKEIDRKYRSSRVPTAIYDRFAGLSK